MDTHSRAPKQLGDFGEGLVTYALIRKGYEVAHVDHVGADLIAEKNHKRFAISVKTRMYRAGSKETRGTVIETGHLENLKHFANRFSLEPVFAHLVCVSDEKIIHLFMLKVCDLEGNFDKVQHGYRLRFSKEHLDRTIALDCMDYSSWSNESIGTKDF